MAREGELPPKQERFCHEYLVDMNATQAAIRAGFAQAGAHVTASRLLKNPKIRARMSVLQKPMTEKVFSDAEYVLRQAKKLHERCMAEETFNAAGAAKALEIIGKHTDVQAFLERRDVTSSDGSMSPAKIERVVVTVREDA